MSQRPPIPENLRRMVLVEAGHRCAIHTCKSTEIDVHHIIPWEKCKDHKFENLIALCPNCHRRSHKGEIDRKSLLMYKAKLSHNQGFYQSPALLGSLSWETKEINVEENHGFKLRVEYEYPQFNLPGEDYRALNTILEGEANEFLIKSRAMTSEFGVFDEALGDLNQCVFSSAYTIRKINNSAISMQREIYSYMAGCAHPNHSSHGENFYLNPLQRIELDDAFLNSKEALEAISDYCITFLEKEDRISDPSLSIREGASPEWKNFASFYIADGGLVITFEPYQVGCHASGERFVPISYRFIDSILPESSRLRSALA